ncbi:hypothetical protein GLOIN_2v1882318 [Rhizophagus clarus]|uniref:DUF7431 domain-containing protein n=1 Tax=Rhizophagus clarus TaxID=94130 RepID=A0A8H3QIH4_9GLOM|nr:hypothetical protein GLOIN_2v1882318 [Rhizophagus clarus]
MTSEEIIVFIKIVENSASLQKSILKKLNQNDSLSDIRKELENTVIDDMLLFSKRENNNKFGVLNNEEEKKFRLKEIIEVENGQNILYLERVYWKFLSKQHKLEYGRIMGFDGVKIAGRKAYMINECELDEINDGLKKSRLEFESDEDWMKKTNLFFDVDINMTNFVKFGLSIDCLRDKSFSKEIKSTYEYTEISKVSLKFSKADLKLTKEFKYDVIEAIKSNNSRESLEKIIEEYGQIIPTEIILGGRAYFNDVKKSSNNSVDISNNITGNIGFGLSNSNVGFNFNNSERTSKFYNFNHIGSLGGYHPDSENFKEEDWIKSLKNYQCWECIEFKSFISIYDLINDLLNENSHKTIYEILGSKILYTSTKECDYFLDKPERFRIFELKNYIPRDILQIIDDKKADVYATVFDTNKNSKDIFFNCQILRGPNTRPSIIIHGIQNEFRRCTYKLKIKIIVIGYDTDFNPTLPDTSVELIKNVYDPQNPCEFYSIPLKQKLHLLEKNVPFFGIPVLESLELNESLIIGHNFCSDDNKYKIDIFSYCLKKKCYVNLPKITFCTFIISNHPPSSSYRSLSFNFQLLKNPFIDLDTHSINPKLVSLYLLKDNDYKPIFLNQKIKQIKLKYLDCKCGKTCFICKNKKVKVSKKEVGCVMFDHKVI